MEHHYMNFHGSAAIASADTWTDILTLEGYRHLSGTVNLEIENDHASQATTGIRILLRDHVNGEWYEYLADADFGNSSLTNLLFASYTTGSAAFHTLTAGHFAHCHVLLNACQGLKVQAKAAAAGSVTVRGGLVNTL